MKIYRDRMLTVRFWMYFSAALAIALAFLSGCTLPQESGNYSPAPTYLWTEPGMWEP